MKLFIISIYSLLTIWATYSTLNDSGTPESRVESYSVRGGSSGISHSRSGYSYGK